MEYETKEMKTLTVLLWIPSAVPDYLISVEKYVNCLKGEWSVGIPFQMFFSNYKAKSRGEYFKGIINKFLPLMPNNMLRWEVISVYWQQGSVYLIISTIYLFIHLE